MKCEKWLGKTNPCFPPETNGKVIPRITVHPFLHPLPPVQKKIAAITTSFPSRGTATTGVAMEPYSETYTSPHQ